MMFNIIMFCLMGAVFANPIFFNAILKSNELDSNSTESLSVSQSSENGTSELQSSEENTSSQSQSSESESESESESLESTSEDKTSVESNNLSDEDDVLVFTEFPQADFMAETRDNSMGSEENVRKSWVQVFASVIQVLSAEDNSSAEVKGQPDHLTEKEPTHTFTFRQGTITNLPLVENTTDSDSSDTSEVMVATNDSSESTSSESNETSKSSETSESIETSETSESSDSSDSSDASKTAEESDASDSAELVPIKTTDCVNGTQSCESDEYLFQDIGDDAHYSVDSLMVPDENEREFSLRR